MHHFPHLLLALLASTPSDEAKAALAPFQKTLKETLFKALERSTEAAVEVCSERAPALAREASTARVTVGRSGLKLRNPANAPPAWLPPLLDELSKLPPGTQTGRTVTLPDGRVGYAEPIWTAPPCLVCHGPVIAPGLDATLRARYPADAARGFAPGSFRGVFWAEVAPAAAKPDGGLQPPKMRPSAPRDTNPEIPR